MEALNSAEEVGEVVEVHKPTADTSLGLTFRDPDDYPSLRMADGTVLCFIERTRPGSISETFLETGDRILAIEGTPCTGPMAAAKQLRGLVGDFKVEILRASAASLRPDSSAAAEKADEELEAGRQEQVVDEEDADTQQQIADVRPRSPTPQAPAPQPTGTHAKVAGVNMPPSPATPSTVMGSFHLHLPGADLAQGRDNPRDPKIFGNRGHVRLGGDGSAKELLKEHGAASPRVRPLSARFRQLSTLLTPRGSHA